MSQNWVSCFEREEGRSDEKSRRGSERVPAFSSIFCLPSTLFFSTEERDRRSKALFLLPFLVFASFTPRETERGTTELLSARSPAYRGAGKRQQSSTEREKSLCRQLMRRPAIREQPLLLPSLLFLF